MHVNQYMSQVDVEPIIEISTDSITLSKGLAALFKKLLTHFMNENDHRVIGRIEELDEFMAMPLAMPSDSSEWEALRKVEKLRATLWTSLRSCDAWTGAERSRSNQPLRV